VNGLTAILKRRSSAVLSSLVLVAGASIAWLCVRPVINRDSAFSLAPRESNPTRSQRIERERVKARAIASRELPLMGSSEPLHGTGIPRSEYMPQELRGAFSRTTWTDEEVGVLVGLLERRVAVPRPAGQGENFDTLHRAGVIMSAGQRLILEGLTPDQSERLAGAVLALAESHDPFDRMYFQTAVFRNALWSWPGWLEVVKGMARDSGPESKSLAERLERLRRRKLID
jgi:hypothetical protein